MISEIPFILPLVFGVSLVVVLIIYVIGGKISAKGSQNEPGKTAPYACGEDIAVGDVKIDLERFLTFAVYFLIFDVFAFVTVTSFYTIGLMPIAYSLIVLMAVAMLIFSKKRL
ncbi:MAG: NADH-quinone oxidoreductase subunit A [Candidatus Bathyarchaeia archaeon]|jgi:NADH:ubiquinone oxidoreductase subunit 3 (subunit A)